MTNPQNKKVANHLGQWFCPRCELWKDPDEYGKDSVGKSGNGLRNTCRQCESDDVARQRVKRREAMIARDAPKLGLFNFLEDNPEIKEEFMRQYGPAVEVYVEEAAAEIRRRYERHTRKDRKVRSPLSRQLGGNSVRKAAS